MVADRRLTSISCKLIHTRESDPSVLRARGAMVVFVSKIAGLETGLLGAEQLCLSCCHPSIYGGNERKVRLSIVHVNMEM